MSAVQLPDATPATISALALLLMLDGLGHKVTRRGDGLIVSNRAALAPSLIEAIQHRKAELLVMVTK